MRTIVAAVTLLFSSSETLRADTFVYVSESRENAIKIFQMDDSTGALKEMATSNVSGGPGSLCVDPEHRFLFASIRSTTSLASFRIDRANGNLQPISSTALAEGANAAYVSTDRQGKFLFSASYSGGRVVVHAIAADGKISERALQTVETARTAHCAVVDTENRLVFVPHVAPNAVFQFKFNSETGQLADFGRAPGGAENAGPRHLALHPSGKFAFASDESGSSVTVYSLNPQDGLKAVQTLSTLPAGYTERNSTADVKVHSSGKYVWVSNRGHDSLAGFVWDEATGKLRSLGQTPTEKTPRSFDVDPTGRFLFAAGEGSGKLAAYQIDVATGQLTRTHTYDVGKSLSWVMVVKL